jgi:hypothetical protein
MAVAEVSQKKNTRIWFKVGPGIRVDSDSG